MYVLEVKRLFVQNRRAVITSILPGRYVCEMLIVAPCLALRGLAFLAEVPTARLGSIERVAAQDLPVPYALNLEALVLPDVSAVVKAVKRTMYLE